MSWETRENERLLGPGGDLIGYGNPVTVSPNGTYVGPSGGTVYYYSIGGWYYNRGRESGPFYVHDGTMFTSNRDGTGTSGYAYLRYDAVTHYSEYYGAEFSGEWSGVEPTMTFRFTDGTSVNLRNGETHTVADTTQPHDLSGTVLNLGRRNNATGGLDFGPEEYDRSYVARYALSVKPVTTVEWTAGGSVEITSSDGESEQVDSDTIRRWSNSRCSITAVPAARYVFAGWSDGDQTSSRTVDPGTYRALFTFVNRMTVAVEGPGRVNGRDSGWTVDSNSALSLLAEPNAHARFVGWFVGSAKVSDSPAYTLQSADGASVTARFAMYGRVSATFSLEAESGADGRLEACGFIVDSRRYDADQTATVESWEDDAGTIPVSVVVETATTSENVVAQPKSAPLFQTLGWYQRAGDGGLVLKSASGSWGAPRDGNFVARLRLRYLVLRIMAVGDGSVGDVAASGCRIDVLRGSVMIASAGLEEPVRGLFSLTDRLVVRAFSGSNVIARGLFANGDGIVSRTPVGEMTGSGIDADTGAAYVEFAVDPDLTRTLFEENAGIEVEFTRASPLRCVVLTSNEGGLAAGNTVALSNPAEASGEFYAGPQRVVSYAAPGWEVTRWHVVLDAVMDGDGGVAIPEETVVDLRKRRLSDGSGQTMEDPGFSTESCAFVLTRAATVSVEFSRVRYRVEWKVDEASVSGSRRTVTLEWKDVSDPDYHGNREGEQWVRHNASNTEGWADVPAGANVRLSPTDLDDTDPAVVTADERFAGYSFRGWFLPDGTRAFSADRNPLTLTVRSGVSLVAKFGAKIYALCETSGPDLPTGILVSVSNTADAVGDEECEFTYGDSVFLHWTPVEDEEVIGPVAAPLYFHGWKERNDATAPTLDVAPVGAGVGRFAPPGQREYEVWAFYSNDVPVRYIRLTNNGAEFGRLSIEAASSAGSEVTVEEISAAEFEEYLSRAYPRPQARLMLAGSGGAVVADGPEDVFAKVTGIGDVIVSCAPLTEESLFSEWKAAGYLPGPATEEATTFSSHSAEQFTPLRDMLLVATYSAEEENALFVRFAMGSSSANGSVSISPARNNFRRGETAHVAATPLSGFRFSGWHERPDAGDAAFSTKPAFDMTFDSSGTTRILYAKFEPDAEAVYEWEGGRDNKQLRWRSKRFKTPAPFNPSSARVYADGYPLTLAVDMSSSPDDPVSQTAGRHSELTLSSQDARRLPRLRPEKYAEVEVSSTFTVTQIDVSTAMLGVRTGP